MLKKSNHDIAHWDAEDVDAWESGGKEIAKRNLIWSIIAEHVGFSVGSIWSVMVLFMPQDVYGIDAAGKFYLVAMRRDRRLHADSVHHRTGPFGGGTGPSSAPCCC